MRGGPDRRAGRRAAGEGVWRSRSGPAMGRRRACAAQIRSGLGIDRGERRARPAAALSAQGPVLGYELLRPHARDEGRPRPGRASVFLPQASDHGAGRSGSAHRRAGRPGREGRLGGRACSRNRPPRAPREREGRAPLRGRLLRDQRRLAAGAAPRAAPDRRSVRMGLARFQGRGSLHATGTGRAPGVPRRRPPNGWSCACG